MRVDDLGIGGVGIAQGVKEPMCLRLQVVSSSDGEKIFMLQSDALLIVA